MLVHGGRYMVQVHGTWYRYMVQVHGSWYRYMVPWYRYMVHDTWYTYVELRRNASAMFNCVLTTLAFG